MSRRQLAAEKINRIKKDVGDSQSSYFGRFEGYIRRLLISAWTLGFFMIIDLKAIPGEGSRSFEFILDKDWWNPNVNNDLILGFNRPLRVRAVIYRAGDKYILDGDLEGSLQVICDRCLDPYNRDLRVDFKVILALPPPNMERAEIELLEEDMEINIISDEEIDLDDIIKEQLYLSLPLKSLCREECLGLCPICGSNLNDEMCTCKKEQGHPDLSKLKSFQIEGE